jgi:hypothetical protein
MIVYKLTDSGHYTRRGNTGETKWVPGVEVRATGNGARLCTRDVIHAYAHPLLAAFLNPIHARLTNPILWRGETTAIVANDGVKLGVKALTLTEPMPLPVFSSSQLARAAILIALELAPSWKGKARFEQWAKNWLNRHDRSERAARAAGAAAAAAAAARAAVARAAWAAAREAGAARATVAEAWAAAEASAAEAAARTAERAAEAAARTAERAAEAAEAEAAWAAWAAEAAARAAEATVAAAWAWAGTPEEFSAKLIKILERVRAEEN